MLVSTGSLKVMSAASGLFFGVFLAMHLVCHYSLVLGMDTANDNLRFFRTFYQHPVFEVGLLIALVAHMASNTVLYLKRQKVHAGAAAKTMHETKKVAGGTEGSAELTGHRYAGYFLSASILGHVGATRLAPLFLLDNPADYDYTFLTHANALFGGLFGVYLALLGVAGGWHLIYGTRSAIATLTGSSVVGTPFPFALKPVAATSHILIVNAILAATGYYYVIDTETKAALFEKVYFMFEK